MKKDFWNEVIIFTSKDDNLTKSHVKYLESRIVEISKETERYSIENGNNPTLSSLPLPDKDAMEEFLFNIRILTGTLGHKFLESTISLKSINADSKVINAPKKELEKEELNEELKLFLNVKEVKAEAIQTNEGLVVLKGSEVAPNRTKNYGYGALREKLISEKVIQKNENNKLFFSKNYLFTSVSGAAAVIVGYSINGRSIWKNEEGKSINEIEKRKIAVSNDI